MCQNSIPDMRFIRKTSSNTSYADNSNTVTISTMHIERPFCNGFADSVSLIQLFMQQSSINQSNLLTFLRQATKKKECTMYNDRINCKNKQTNEKQRVKR